MKKVIFISALAIAAAVSCTKSDIVDTKFNEQIGFETYLGRDAQTKAAVETIKTVGQVGVYGYYTGATASYSTTSEANLWSPLALVVDAEGELSQPSGVDVRYWTNDSDYYTFLAYAPKERVNVVAGEKGEDPTIKHTVNATLKNQVDVLSADPQINRTKVGNETVGNNGSVLLDLKHRLARLTVKAASTTGDFDYHIKSITVKGGFYVSGDLKLADETPSWENTKTAATEEQPDALTSYSFPVDGDAALPKTAPDGNFKDYSDGGNYLMTIPVEKTQHNATLEVVYTTSYMAGEKKMESVPYTKTFPISNDFVMGKAYAVKLVFQQETNNKIQFTVEVDDWAAEETTTHNPAN